MSSVLSPRVGAAWIAITGTVAPAAIALTWPAWCLDGHPATRDALVAWVTTYVAATTFLAWAIALPKSVAERAGCCLFIAALVSTSTLAWALADAVACTSLRSAAWAVGAVVNAVAVVLARSLCRLLPEDPTDSISKEGNSRS